MTFKQALIALDEGKWVRRRCFAEDWSSRCFISHQKSLPAAWKENERIRAYLEEEGSPDFIWVYLDDKVGLASSQSVCPCNLASARFTEADEAATDWEIYELPETNDN